MNPELCTFNVELKHESDHITFTVYGQSIASAIEQVMQAEKCPESAIISVRRISGKDDR